MRRRFAGVERVEPVLRGDGVIGRPDLVDGVEEGTPDALREHRHERDERQPDHQGRRGRAGPLGIPLRVLPRERPGSAAEPHSGRTQHRRQRHDELRREERHPEEDE